MDQPSDSQTTALPPAPRTSGRISWKKEWDRASAPTTLYRLYDGQGALLYIGIAIDPGRRFIDHRADKPWWPDVSSVRFEVLPDRAQALAAERDAIRAEGPLHNVAHNGSQRDAGSGLGAPQCSGPSMPDGLIGQFFHSLVDGKVEWQGVVVSRPEPGIYLVTLFEWRTGGDDSNRLVRVEDMIGWIFYDSSEWMAHSYEYGPAYKHRRSAPR